MKRRKDGARDVGAGTPDDERKVDIERKQKKLRTVALVSQAFCGVLALVAIAVIAVVVCK